MYLNAQRRSSGLNDGQRLRMDFLVDEELAPLVVSVSETHGFCRPRAFVQQRGVSHIQARQADHHRLPVEQRLQPALGDFRLIRRVLRRPARVLEHVAQDGVGNAAIVVAHADVRAPHLVLAPDGLDLADEFVLADGRLQVHLPVEDDALRTGEGDEVLETLYADRLQHVVTFLFRRTYVTSVYGETDRRIDTTKNQGGPR